MKLPDKHTRLPQKKTGVLLINLGTPDSTKWWDIRKYLKEFLSDKRVIEVNPILWQIILNLFILTFRPSKTAKAYQKIWMKRQNMSPLRYFTIKQTTNLQKRMKNKSIEIDYAMRYGNPAIAKKLSELKDKGCQEMVILPLYPQYAAATTATVCDEVYRTLMKMRWQPSLQVIPHYESEPLYNRDQPFFLNSILQFSTTLKPFDVLDLTQKVEKMLGRSKTKKKNQPRIIDIDILFHGDAVLETEKLIIPHPMISLRKFVLLPFVELAPEFNIPHTNLKINDLLENCPDNSSVKKYQINSQA